MLFRLVLIIGALVLTACAGGPGEVASAPSGGTIPAQGPCDEPLLDGDAVAASGTGGVMLVAADVVLADGPLYESVESLAASSDLVVRGTVGPAVGSADTMGPSAAIRQVEVLEALAGEPPAELRVVFGLGDTAGERCAPVVEGRQVLLFLGAAGTDTDATHFVIGSHNNGVMTVDGDHALAHSWVPGRLRESDPPRDDLPEDGGFPPPGLAFDLDDVRDVIDDTAGQMGSNGATGRATDDEQIVKSVESSCAEETTPANLRNQAEAFDATVLTVERGDYNDNAAAAPLRVELQVNEWFKSASDAPPETIVRDSWDFSPPEPLPEEVVTDLGPGLEPGLRLLSAGSGEGVGDLQVANCGFAIPWTEDARDDWRGIFDDG